MRAFEEGLATGVAAVAGADVPAGVADAAGKTAGVAVDVGVGDGTTDLLGEAAGEATAGSWGACAEGDAAWAATTPGATVSTSAKSTMVDSIPEPNHVPVRVRLRESFHLLVQLPVSLPVRLRVRLPIRWPVRLSIKLSMSLPIPTSTCLCREVHCEKGWPFGQLPLRFRLGLLCTGEIAPCSPDRAALA